MNIVLIKSERGTSYHNFTVKSLFFMFSFLFACIISVSGYLGFYIAKQQQPQKYISAWQDEIETQRGMLASVENFSNTRINALTNKIGDMQGKINRINAVGSRLLSMVDIKSDEFDFNKQISVGGPSTYKESNVKVTELDELIASVKTQLESRALQLSVLEELLLNRDLQYEILPSGRPIKKGWLSSHYGMRTDPFTGKLTMHKGIDFAGNLGSDVLTVASGVVTWAGKRYGYGQLVEINHGNGYVTRYGHNQKILVKEGDAVQKGSVISKMGSSGRSTGPHVHFEVLKNGKQIDPQKYLSARR